MKSRKTEVISKNFTGKKVAFITTKNLDYIRNTQEIKMIQEGAEELVVIGSESKNYLARVLYVYFYILFHSFKRYDVVFVGFSPQLVIPIWRWKLGKVVWIDFFISMYDTFVDDRKKFADGSLVSNVFRALDKFTLEHCSEIIVDTNAHGKYFAEEFGIPKEKFHVYYLEADSDIYRETMNMESDECFKVLYFGSILPVQGVEIIQEAIKQTQHPKLKFEIIGPVKEKITRDDVTYYEWLSQKELAEHIASANLCLAGHFSDTVGKANRTVPGKAYIYEAMDKKMILGDSDANREYFAEDEKHHFVKRGDAKALSDKILELVE